MEPAALTPALCLPDVTGAAEGRGAGVTDESRDPGHAAGAGHGEHDGRVCQIRSPGAQDQQDDGQAQNAWYLLPSGRCFLRVLPSGSSLQRLGAAVGGLHLTYPGSHPQAGDPQTITSDSFLFLRVFFPFVFCFVLLWATHSDVTWCCWGLSLAQVLGILRGVGTPIWGSHMQKPWNLVLGEEVTFRALDLLLPCSEGAHSSAGQDQVGRKRHFLCLAGKQS